MKDFLCDLVLVSLVGVGSFIVGFAFGMSKERQHPQVETRITESRSGYLASVQRVVGANNSYFIVAVEFDGEVHYYDVAPDKVITKQSVDSRATVEIKDGVFIIFMPTTDKLI